jgi:hypothetical protein
LGPPTAIAISVLYSTLLGIGRDIVAEDQAPAAFPAIGSRSCRC